MSKAVAIGMIAGSIAVAATGGGAAYYVQRHAKPDEAAVRAAQAETERQRYVRDEEINYATLISTVAPPTRGAGSMPVMVTFHLAGSKGLGEFCRERPLVEEALLRALERDGMRAAVREAVNRVLEGSPVRGASLRPMTDPAVGGKAEYDTAKKCKQAAADAKKAAHT
jgi:hypothetical protein